MPLVMHLGNDEFWQGMLRTQAVSRTTYLKRMLEQLELQEKSDAEMLSDFYDAPVNAILPAENMAEAHEHGMMWLRCSQLAERNRKRDGQTSTGGSVPAGPPGPTG